MAYAFSRAITIDHTKVGAADQANFPVLVSGTYAYLATTGNGGNVQSGSGFDIAFYSDAGLTTQLKHETELWTAATGAVVYWVKVPTVATASDTVIYLAYGDAAVVTDQSDKVNVWDANYKLVYHLSDNAATTAIADSTSNAQNATNLANTSTKTATGQINKGLLYNGTSDGSQSNATVDLTGTATLTLEFWLKWDTNANDDKLLGETDIDFSNGDGRLLLDPNGSGNTKFDIATRNIAQGANHIAVITRPTAATWHHHFITIDRAVASLTVPMVTNWYVDGVAQTVTQVGGAATSLSGNWANQKLNLMCRNQASLFGAGTLDEFRISTVARSTSWGVTAYNSQSSPATFYAVGAASGGGGTTLLLPYRRRR